MSTSTSVPTVASEIEDRRDVGSNDVASAAPDFVMAAAFLVAWAAPHALPGGTVRWLLSVMLLEFVVIHAAGFMGTVALSSTRQRRHLRTLVFMGVIYLTFGAGLSYSFRSPWPFLILALQIANRFTWVLFGQAPVGGEKLYLQRSWIVGTLFYIGGAAMAAMLPIPRLGISYEVHSTLDLPASGLLVDEPWRLMAFGIAYFAGTGWSEMVRHRWLPPVRIPKILIAPGDR